MTLRIEDFKISMIMKRLLSAVIVCLAGVIAGSAQSFYHNPFGRSSTTNYYNQYGNSTGSSRSHSNIYGGGTTTNYYDIYGRSTGSARTHSDIFGGGTTTDYYDQYGRMIGTSHRSNSGF